MLVLERLIVINESDEFQGHPKQMFRLKKITEI